TYQNFTRRDLRNWNFLKYQDLRTPMGMNSDRSHLTEPICRCLRRVKRRGRGWGGQGWDNGRMEGWKDGRVEGWKSGRVEEREGGGGGVESHPTFQSST